jgi:hypothetical protein
VRLTVETVPKGAHVSIDDASLPPNAQVVELPKDTVLHKIRAEALGYRPKTDWVRFDSDDVAVKMTLEPTTPGRKVRRESAREGAPPPSPPIASEPSLPPAAAVVPPPPAPAPIREIETAPARRPASSPALDMGDPWKK